MDCALLVALGNLTFPSRPLTTGSVLANKGLHSHQCKFRTGEDLHSPRPRALVAPISLHSPSTSSIFEPPRTRFLSQEDGVKWRRVSDRGGDKSQLSWMVFVGGHHVSCCGFTGINKHIKLMLDCSCQIMDIILLGIIVLY